MFFILLVMWLTLMAVIAVVSVRKKSSAVVIDESVADKALRKEAIAIQKSSANIQNILDNFSIEVKR